MEDEVRRKRQLEYERNLDRWANLAIKRLKKVKKLSKTYTGYPFWYTEFSLLQLHHLNDLKHTMFKDNEEQTAFRTLEALSQIGMITDTVKVKSRTVKKLVNEFNAEPIKFLCEIYKAISGDYFENEKFKYYTCTERIILSGIAFLELPKIIVELHKRLPPIEKIKVPPKPKPVKWYPSKKMPCPYQEEVLMPPDWRADRRAFNNWYKRNLVLVRPVVILPKNERNVHRIEEKDQECASGMSIGKGRGNLEKTTSMTIEPIETDMTDEYEVIKNYSQDISEHNGQTEIYPQYPSPADKHNQDQQAFSLQNWTNPMSRCPFKYRKLMEKVGPLNTDEEFFNELGYEPEKKCFPPGRKNLSVNMQSYLLDLETDLFKVTDDVDKLTCKVGKIAKDILGTDPQCDPCCVCRETHKTYLRSQHTKTPHMLISSLAANKDDKTRVIGATAMHSPVPSMTSYGEPPCIPSAEKLVKNMVITGATTIVDGEAVKQVEGFTKAIEHIPREVLLPESNEVEIKNVPPCKCADPSKDKDADLLLIGEDKNPDLCYGRKFRPEEVPAYTCSEFKKKDGQDDVDNYDDNYDKFISDQCGCGIDFKNCDIDGENEYENSIKSLPRFENIGIKMSQPETVTLKQSCKICKSCGRKVEEKCGSNFTSRKSEASKKDCTKSKIPSTKCSCNSLSEFLQFDLTKTKCKMVSSARERKANGSSKRRSDPYQRKGLNPLRNIRKSSANKISKTRERKTSTSMFSMMEDEGEREYEDMGESLKKESLYMDTETMKSKSISIQEKPEELGGPYGLKTASEEALPVVRTIAYLTDQHPPDQPVGQIPVGPGKRPCRCRENRNNRKTLAYNIGGLACDEPEKKESLPPVIEGVTWITPEPSIRRSDEYIPEYELYDSPYKNVCARSKKVSKKCKEDGEKKTEGKKGCKKKVEKTRSQDWQNSFNDPYLTDMFIKKPDKVSCHTKCSKFPKQNDKLRKLRVMNPVCECKYERKIVKRNEDRQKWVARQSRLKSFRKEPFMHISEISRPVSSIQKSESPDYHCGSASTKMKCFDCESELTDTKNMDPPELVVSAITMQTPVITPTECQSKSSSIRPRQSAPNNEGKKSLTKTDASSHGERAMSKSRPSQDERAKSLDNQLEKTLNEENKNRESKDSKRISGNKAAGDRELEMSPAKVKKGKNYLNEMEENLKIQVHEELKKMADENFISLKLPNFHKMPQLLYWISYRVKGMRFTNTYKKELMKRSLKKWIDFGLRINPRTNDKKPFVVKRKDRSRLNFDSAIFWKKRIAAYKRQFYTKLRSEILDLGRDLWPSMEFGKFPDIVFKQAYFTYIPSREKDAHVVSLWNG